MRIKVDIEVSPEEIRTLIGLPNLGGLQEDMIHYMRDKMSSGMEESKEIALMLKQFLPESISTASNLQKMFSKGVERFTSEMNNATKANSTTEKPAASDSKKSTRATAAGNKTTKATTSKKRATKTSTANTTSSTASSTNKKTG